MTRGSIDKRIALLERQKSVGDRVVHFIKAANRADSERQIAELVTTGKVGPRDGFISLTGWKPLH
ncbi:hypothetical protein [Bradyrhizobium diazoefficiens]|uniref:hypothetical protein n=1 Tax=Bradyrhizobium diazoefficiens TaxID=1355477 RepID=UPI002729DDA0|nr:hypothetical protein [Bradyrhizobium diazoefficiens]WLA57204.1 hypothetical protein QIH81_00230 [Bradyrhizobium diazoefficiens]